MAWNFEIVDDCYDDAIVMFWWDVMNFTRNVLLCTKIRILVLKEYSFWWNLRFGRWFECLMTVDDSCQRWLRDDNDARELLSQTGLRKFEITYWWKMETRIEDPRSPCRFVIQPFWRGGTKNLEKCLNFLLLLSLWYIFEDVFKNI